MINVQNLTKTFAQKSALKNISFCIAPNQITGLLGPNGAGKTTTLKILTGTLLPTSGTITIGKHNLSENRLDIQKTIGYVPETSFLYPHMNVLDFLIFAGRIRQLTFKTLQKNLKNVVEICNLEEVLSQKIMTLSKGFKQRVGLAQALLHDPQILILDEPTEGLDPKQILNIRALLKTLSATKTILFSSHILSEVEKLCEDIIILNNGTIAFNGPLQDLGKNAYDIETKFMELFL